jgi:hypothetical protein
MVSVRSIFDGLLEKDTMNYLPPASPPFQPMFHPPPPGPRPIQHLPPAVPWLLIDDKEVRSSTTNAPLFAVTRSAAPGSLSSKSLITLTRVATGAPLGTVRFRSSSDSIELTVNGAITKMKNDTVMHTKLSFQPTTFSHARWYWKQGKEGVTLTDGKDGGLTLAKINGSTLVVENLGLPEAAVDEIVLSAVAMLAKIKKLGKEAEAAEGVGEVISALAGS